MLRLAADENFNNDVVRGVRRRNPAVDIVRVQDAGLSGADDPSILEWAAQTGARIYLFAVDFFALDWTSQPCQAKHSSQFDPFEYQARRGDLVFAVDEQVTKIYDSPRKPLMMAPTPRQSRIGG
jgi:hypothetical protein